MLSRAVWEKYNFFLEKPSSISVCAGHMDIAKNGWFLKNSYQVLPFCSVDSCRNERNGNQISGERKAIETVENIAQICILYWVTFA